MAKETVWYSEKRTLACRGAVDSAPDELVEGILLVGEKSILNFYDNQSSFGEDSVSIYPAIHDGKRCWLRCEDWQPAEGYSCYGLRSEFIISFEDGVRLFLERGVFEFPKPEEVKQ